MALHQPDLATNSYELAKAAGGPAAKLDQKQAEAKKAGGKLISVDAHKELQELRTVTLGAAEGRSGVAEYKMLLAKGRVQRVEPAEDKSIAGGAEMIEKMQIPAMFPPDSDARLARSAMLNCYAGQCKLVFEP
jgi:hypothetical protein